MLVDSHAHLEMKDFDRDRDRVIARAQEAGVTQIVTVATTLPDIYKALKIAREHDCVHVALGIHPHEVKDIQPGDYEEMRRLAWQEKKVVAFGEIGLDFYRNHSPREVQLSRFRELLRLGKELNLPIIIHDREAHEETLRILEEEKDGVWRGVFHCFSGDPAMARKVIQMGFSISIPGAVTFSKSLVQQEVAQKIPLEKILLETDCPYLAPEPHRGKRNEPAFVRFTAEKVASLRGLTLNDVARITSGNARRLFGIGEEIPKGKISYPIRNSLYLNLTNRCSIKPLFARNASYVVKGHDLERTTSRPWKIFSAKETEKMTKSYSRLENPAATGYDQSCSHRLKRRGQNPDRYGRPGEFGLWPQHITRTEGAGRCRFD
jgi:TatD DNase family protein